MATRVIGRHPILKLGNRLFYQFKCESLIVGVKNQGEIVLLAEFIQVVPDGFATAAENSINFVSVQRYLAKFATLVDDPGSMSNCMHCKIVYPLLKTVND
jgi:hypothetical protein